MNKLEHDYNELGQSTVRAKESLKPSRSQNKTKQNKTITLLMMFRSEDIPAPKFHSTYRNKPVPINQLQSQVSKFSDDEIKEMNGNMYREKRQATIFDQTPTSIPITYDTHYEPNHPDADWAGLVLTANGHKKHIQNHSNQTIQIHQTENGIVSTNSERYEFHKKRIQAPGANKIGNEKSIFIPQSKLFKFIYLLMALSCLTV